MKRTTSILLTVLCLSFLSGCAPSAEKTSLPSSGVRVSSAGSDAAEPSIASDAQGNIYVVYVEHGADKTGDVFLQKFDKDLKPLGEKVRVNQQPGQANAWRGDQPSILVGTAGGGDDPGQKIYVAWNSRIDAAEGAANNLMMSVSINGGETFLRPSEKVNDDAVPASHGMHATAAKGEDNYFAWLDERYLKKETRKQAPEKKTMDLMHHEDEEPNAELYFGVVQDNGKTMWGPNKKIAGDICPCCKVSMIRANDGRLYISWRQVLKGDLRHIAVTSSSDNGETFAEPTIVSDDKWHINACPVSGAPLAIGRDGALGIAWYTAGEAGAPGLYWAESKDQGKTFSPRNLLSEGVIFGTPVMLFDDKVGYRLVWTANGRVFTQNVTEQKPREIAEGELPAAVSSGNGLYVSYIKNEGGKRAVWLSRVEN